MLVARCAIAVRIDDCAVRVRALAPLSWPGGCPGPAWCVVVGMRHARPPDTHADGGPSPTAVTPVRVVCAESLFPALEGAGAFHCDQTGIEVSVLPRADVLAHQALQQGDAMSPWSPGSQTPVPRRRGLSRCPAMAWRSS